MRKQLLESSHLYFASNVDFTPIKTNIDAFIWKKEKRVFFETDGPFHFTRLISTKNVMPRLNGQTFLKTLVMVQYGKVLRVSTKCDDKTFHQRVNRINKYVSDLISSDNQVSPIDPENYDSLKKSGYPVVVPSIIRDAHLLDIYEEAQKRRSENQSR